MEFRNGMNEVYTPDHPIQAVANIVFVHGLFGGPWKTFAAIPRQGSSQHSSANSVAGSRRLKASSGVYWPRDLLPKSIHNANVFSFGYDADVGRFMGAAGQNTVFHHGRNLLNDLSDLLKKHGSLPFLIVVHSLGGLVVKEALNQSASSTDVERSRVLQMTRRVIFLGTPHRGSSAATYGRLAFKLMKIFALQNANTQLISSLERGSDVLGRISATFVETLAKANDLRLWSFAEEKQIRWGLVGMHIVPSESARIGHEREDWGTISADHRQIAKYSNIEDEGFGKVSRVLRDWINEALLAVAAKDKQVYGDCLESLDDSTARLRVQEVSQASRVNKGSFEWLFTDRVAYTKWLADDGSTYDPIFWITGKPGSGKSTLMRFALEDPRSESLLPPSIGHPMAYFFHLRGKSLVQKSLQGMMQELLYQTLKQFPDFFMTLKPVYKKTVSKTGLKAKWDLEDLIEGFSLIPDLKAPSIGGKARIFLFIDALDENQDPKNNTKLVGVLRDIVEKYRMRKALPGAPLLKICLASRPWPSFSSAFGGQPRIPSLAVDEFTADDIKAYTQDLLFKPLLGTQYPEQYRQSVLRLSEKTTALAQGVFVWVRVVVDSLYQQIIDGTPVKSLENILERYPTELDELYEFTIRRIPKEYRKETEVALKVVQRSRVQLTLREIYEICVICVEGDLVRESEPPEVPASWLASRCGGLIQTISQTEDEAHRPDVEVQFIHQTVQDFVRQGIKGISDGASNNSALSISGSQFLAFTCRHKSTHQRLRRIYSDAFSYLRDIEEDMGLVHAAQNNELHPTPTFISSAFDLRARDDSAYDIIFDCAKGQPDIFGSGLAPSDYQAISDFMPIWQNLYYFGTRWLSRKRTADSALFAALGPRVSNSRTDRPRMLSRVLPYLDTTDINYLFQNDRPLRESIDRPLREFNDQFTYHRVIPLCVCQFLPHISLQSRLLSTLMLLVSAIPNEHIDDETLLETTEKLLAFGASTSECVEVTGLEMSLLNFVVRFKEGRRNAWINLLRRYGASLFEDEIIWYNQVALSASLSDRNISLHNTSVEAGDSIESAAVILGLGFAGMILGAQSLARACYVRNGNLGRVGYEGIGAMSREGFRGASMLTRE